MAEQLEFGTLNTTLQVIKKARALLSDSGKWTKHAFARDKDGNACTSDNKDAECFCVIGAFRNVTGNDRPGLVLMANSELKSTIGLTTSGELSAWNDMDSRTHSDVLEALDKTIERLEHV